MTTLPNPLLPSFGIPITDEKGKPNPIWYEYQRLLLAKVQETTEKTWDQL